MIWWRVDSSFRDDIPIEAVESSIVANPGQPGGAKLRVLSMHREDSLAAEGTSFMYAESVPSAVQGRTFLLATVDLFDPLR